MIDTAQQEYVTISLDKIVKRLSVRKISESGKKRILASMKKVGFLANYPLIVLALPDGAYLLIDGNHRLEVAKMLGITSVPCVIKTELTELEQFKLALESNTAAETVVPSTLVSNAEFIWARSEEGRSLDDIKDMMEWSLSKVKNYSALSGICSTAWEVIVTTFEDTYTSCDEDDVTTKVTPVTFTETLLRDILPLSSDQQLELVQALADPDKNKRITKGKFKSQAESYKVRNDMKAYATARLGDLGEIYTTQLINAIYSGAYDADWSNTEHPKLHKLIQSLHDTWEEKNSIHLIHGDFCAEAKRLGDGCVDLLLTDPPYNIARDNEFVMEGRSNISQDFGEWDKYEHLQFIDLLDVWTTEWARLLRDQGSGYVFTSDNYISYLRTALEKASLHVKATIVWHKTNPGTQQVKTNYKSSIEYILFFTKGKGGHTFNWQGENEMHNHIEVPICGGNERLSDAKGNPLHPTQKPERILQHFAEISSNRGDTIFDGFMGVGSTGAVAKRLGRKFIGIEQDRNFFDTAMRRLTNG